jgi:hypothetical protein
MAAGTGVGVGVGDAVGVGASIGTGSSLGMVMPGTSRLAVLPARSRHVPVAVWFVPMVSTVTLTLALAGPEVASVQANVAVTGCVAIVPGVYVWPSAVLRLVRLMVGACYRS